MTQHTVSNDLILSRLVTDFGMTSNGLTPPTHIISHTPGMGILSSLVEATKSVEEAGLGSRVVIPIDALVDDLVIKDGQHLFAGVGITALADNRIIIIDATDTLMSAEDVAKTLDSVALSHKGSHLAVIPHGQAEKVKNAMETDAREYVVRLEAKVSRFNEEEFNGNVTYLPSSKPNKPLTP